MAEKNDDIKQLFAHLGLNPNDYHEIRSAPSANVTVSEAPRRWSLLQSASAVRHEPTPMASAMPTPVQAMPSAMAAVPSGAERTTAAAPGTEAEFAGGLAQALLAAAHDIARVEGLVPPQATIAPVPAPAAVLPAVLSSAFAEPSTPPAPAPAPAPVVENPQMLGLQSLFQSVKEPQTASLMMGKGQADRPTERRTDQMFQSMPASSPADRVSAMDAAAAKAAVTQERPKLLDTEPETRYSPPPSRLGPVPVLAPPPMPASAPISVASVSAAGSGRLKFASREAERADAHGESLRDVFRRLSRENRTR